MPLLNNRYQILETLGRGGFGETFLATDTHMPSARQCVIKLLKPVIEAPQIPEWLQERFQREAIILEELGENHPQIPRLYAYFTEKGNFYLVQEWIEGQTLTQKQEQMGNFSSEMVQNILIELLPVLDFVHQRRIIHRDIKPDNIIIRAKDNQPILIDFGVIKEAMGTVVSSDGKTAYSIALGTPGYMASEQAAGRPVYSSDLYSLGLTAIFLLTGKTPQYLDTDSQTGEILWRDEAPQVSPHLAEVLDRCIRFHPRDRFASARDMLKALVARIPEVTAATLVVKPPKRESKTEESRRSQPITTSEEEEEHSGQSPFVTWFVLPIIFLLVIVGGLSAGFLIATKKRRPPEPTPTPTVTETATPTPTPEFVPTPPPVFATPRPTPRRSLPPTPAIAPTVEISPTPQASTTPSPELPPEPTETTAPIESPAPPASPKPLPSSSPIQTSPPPKPTPTAITIPSTVPSQPSNPNYIEPPAPPVQEKPFN